MSEVIELRLEYSCHEHSFYGLYDTKGTMVVGLFSESYTHVGGVRSAIYKYFRDFGVDPKGKKLVLHVREGTCRGIERYFGVGEPSVNLQGQAMEEKAVKTLITGLKRKGCAFQFVYHKDKS